LFIIRDTAPGGLTHVVGKGSRFGWISLESADNIYPIQGMKVIEMYNVVMLKLSAV
jgi:hypothetical protein